MSKWTKHIAAGLTAPIAMAGSMTGCNAPIKKPMAAQYELNVASLLNQGDLKEIDEKGKEKPFSRRDFNGKSLVVFGRFECQMCRKETRNLVKVIQKLQETRSEVPIIVVNINPENDKAENSNYRKEYTDAGIPDRLLHIYYPPSHDAAVTLQKAFGMPFNESDKASHIMRIIAVDTDGRIPAGGIQLGPTDDARDTAATVDGIVNAITGTPPAQSPRKR